MSTADRSTNYAHITHPVDGGEPTIDDLRIRVRDVVLVRDRGGVAPEEIPRTVFPALTLAQVYAALAYYEDHRDEIDAADRRDAESSEAFIAAHPELVIDVRPKRD